MSGTNAPEMNEHIITKMKCSRIALYLPDRRLPVKHINDEQHRHINKLLIKMFLRLN